MGKGLTVGCVSSLLSRRLRLLFTMSSPALFRGLPSILFVASLVLLVRTLLLSPCHSVCLVSDFVTLLYKLYNNYYTSFIRPLPLAFIYESKGHDIKLFALRPPCTYLFLCKFAENPCTNVACVVVVMKTRSVMVRACCSIELGS